MDELVKLKQAEVDARERFEFFAATNVAGKSAAEIVDLDRNYEAAFIAWRTAATAYRQALIAETGGSGHGRI